ncbi:hypothetical protein KVR01_006474 [Diaporthe batatas]|uniref:uncharacterized protein n=1 Tax=Diaporthe batatas TaxID=748121 RepID=UPI001D037CBE|nr:uncharacterized protein KVR01_006474 [Diaporthe batatas]KAG8164556.1 hypothetical protein KVR01_006474 [Diaporthe batatas]
MAGRRITQLALLLLLSSSCAWANDGTRKPERGDLRLGRDDVSPGQKAPLVEVRAEQDGTSWEKVNEEARQQRRQENTSERRIPPQHEEDIIGLQHAQAKSPTAEEAAQITTAPSLIPLIQRQDNNGQQGQIDDLNRRLQSAQQSAQQALQSLSDASRRVSQASQQLSQSSQQLSQQSQQLSQSSQRLSQESQQLSQSLQQATQSVQSLTRAVSDAQSSGSSAFASCTDSASAALARASGELASKVGDAQAQITLANNQAQDQVQQAQGAAVSITQAALAIVGTFIGSSLLTVLVVWLIIRHKRRQKDRIAPPLNTSVSSYYGGRPGVESYGNITRDVKDAILMSPPASGTTTKVGSERARSLRGSRGNDMVTKGYGPEKEAGLGMGPTAGGGGGTGPDSNVQIGYARSTNYRERKTPKLSEPPPARRKDSIPGEGGATTPRTPKYEVFPKVNPSPPVAAPIPGARGGPAAAAAAGGGGGGGRTTPPSPPRRSIQPDYNLQAWLQTGTVSPFGTLEQAANNDSSNNATAATTTPKRTSEVKWPLQGSSSEPPSRSNSNNSTASAAADPFADPEAAAQPGVAVTRDPPAPPRPVTVATARGSAATRSVRVGVESMRGIGLPGVARKLPLRDP